MEIFKANKQWSTRPADERFDSLESLYAATKAYADDAVQASVEWPDLRVEAEGDEIRLNGRTNNPARLTNWAFGQLSSAVGAPAQYLRALPATLAAQNLNHGLKHREAGESSKARLLIHRNGDLLVRAITSMKYSRIWNYEIAERLVGLQGLGWEPARPDIRQSIGDFPALYASDHDMFAFVCHRERTIAEPGNPAGLKRGVIAQNSEVGASALWLLRFLYREMCGNHIIWGARELVEIRIPHIGDARDRWQAYHAEIKKYADSSASDEEAKIVEAKRVKIGDTKEQVLDKLFGVRSIGLSRKVLAESYDAVVPDQDGDANTVWGFVQGATRHSQTVPYADQRTAIDKAAGRILEMSF